MIDGNRRQSVINFSTDRENKGEWKRAAMPGKLSAWIIATLNAEVERRSKNQHREV